MKKKTTLLENRFNMPLIFMISPKRNGFISRTRFHILGIDYQLMLISKHIEYLIGDSDLDIIL